MRHVYMSEEKERQAFATQAAHHFANNPKHWSYSDCEPEAIMPGCWLALRWGLREDCVLVVKVSDTETPVIYAQLIEQARAAA